MRYAVGLLIVCFPLVGLLLIVNAVGELWTTWRRRPFLRAADGFIVDVKVEECNFPGDDDSDNQYVYRPTLRFTTETGAVRQFVSEIASATGGESPYRRGASLPVLYDPDGVLPPRINSWVALWWLPLLLIVSGAIFIGAGALVCLLFGQRVLHGG